MFLFHEPASLNIWFERGAKRCQQLNSKIIKNKIWEKQSVLAFIFLFCMNYCQRINGTILNCYVSLHTHNSPLLEEILISKQLKMSKWVIFFINLSILFQAAFYQSTLSNAHFKRTWFICGNWHYTHLARSALA